MLRKMRFQREADSGWAREVSRRPGCEQLFSCLQCGACSGTCPLSIYMDFGPRRIIALVREGFRHEALTSQTIWLCASCYACAVHCPQQIHITDVMYSLKKEAMRDHLYPKRFPIPVLARQFYSLVRKRGRNPELWLALRMALHTSPLAMLRMWRSAWNLLRTGRLPLHAESIRQIRDFQRELPRKEA